MIMPMRKPWDVSNRYSGTTRTERKGSLVGGIKVDLVCGNYTMPRGSGAPDHGETP